VDIYYSTIGQGGPFDKLITSGVTCSQGNNSYNTWNNVGDDVSGEAEWDHRNWQNQSTLREKLFWLSAEACLML
jgi:hypothetical protein